MRRRKIIPFVLYSIIVAIGWYNSTKFIPFSPVSTIYPKNPLIEKLREQAGTYRVLGLGNAALSTDLATEVRLFDPQYYEPLYNRRYGELVGYAKSKEGEVMKLSRSDVEVDTTIFKENPANSKIQKLYDLLGIGYFFYKKSDVDDSHVFPEIIDWPNDFWTIKANATVLPRVYVVHSVETITEDRIILDRLFDDSFNIRTSAILEKEPSEVIRGTPSDDAAHIDIYKPNDITISVYTKDTGLLVLTDNYDPGWHAFIDGEETDIYRTNYTFRGVIVPYGEHVIRFIYMPQTFILGKAVTIVGFSLLVAAVGLFSLHRFRHRRLI